MNETKLKRFRGELGKSQTALAAELGLSQSLYSRYESGLIDVPHSVLEYLHKSYKMNLHWYFANDSEIFVKLSKPESLIVQDQQPKYFKGPNPVVVTVNETDSNTIVMVSTKVAAGYLRGFGDPEFFRELPTFSLPMLKRGTYRAFQVTGDSMYPTLKESDWVVAEWINPEHFRDDRVYVLVCGDGLLIKRCLNRLSSDEKVIAKSDNVESKLYPVKIIEQADLKEMWEVRGLFSMQLQNPSEIWSRLQDLEGKLAVLDEKVQKSFNKLP